MILLHGRGDTASNILMLRRELAHPDFRYYAPAAAGNTWYPNRFTAPIPSNEPYLTSALQAIAEVLAQVNADDVPPERTLLLGFSQGACLTLEHAFRHPRRYGGIAALSGGLITPPGPETRLPSSMLGTPVFLGCSDYDPHIPEERVRQSAEIFRLGGANVDLRIYPGLGHTLCDDELDVVRAQMQSLLSTHAK